MPRLLRNFEGMWNAYPNPGEPGEAAKRTIGGNVDADWITNTCVVRISRAFNSANHRIPRTRRGLTTVSGADGLRYAFRVKEFRRYLEEVYGPPTLRHVYPGGAGGPIPDSFMGRQGVICFEVDGWTDATGHFDLWRKDRCVHSAYFHKASEVLLWEVSSETSTARPGDTSQLSASVGAGGVNRPVDVRRVQELLVLRGVEPGPVDGACGPRTVAAIRAFQSRFLSAPDGRVDIDGRTWRELLGL